MSPLAICTTLYPAGLPYFDDYCRGLIDAVRVYGDCLHLVLVCDGLDETAFAKQAQDLRRSIELHIVQMADGGPAAARRLMLRTAAALPVAAVICYDMDDIPDPDGLSRHMNALQTASISYGDMDLIDQNGRPEGRTFFSGQRVPSQIADPHALLHRNFMGFTNTAVKREIIEPMANAIPDGITAIDWWFYTSLLSEGYSAARTKGTVVAYRTHDQNTLGAGGVTDDGILLRQCRIMREHYAHLPPSKALRRADTTVEKLIQMPASSRAELTPPQQPGVWYDNVSWACDQMDALG
jgi:hypothetical protein